MLNAYHKQFLKSSSFHFFGRQKIINFLKDKKIRILKMLYVKHLLDF